MQQRHNRYWSPKRLDRTDRKDEGLYCNGHAIGFGMFKDTTHLVVFKATDAQQSGQCPRLVVNLQRKQLELSFCLPVAAGPREEYMFSLRFSQIQSIYEANKEEAVNVVIHCKLPPQAFRKSAIMTNIWPRQAVIEDWSNSTCPVKLLSDNIEIETGRWLVYCLKIRDPAHQKQWHRVSDIIAGAVPISRSHINITLRQHGQWTWSGDGSNILPKKTSSAMLSMVDADMHLQFEVAYQLEVCISHGYLLEAGLDQEFMARLAGLAREDGTGNKARRLLEHVANLKQWFPNPLDIFALQSQVNYYKPNPPSYCVMLQSATITPTTIYFNTPTIEMSNRILRKYSHHDRHFLRVKFRDEQYLGKIKSTDDGSDGAIFRRFRQALTQGISVGGRTFHFLAYGNSQLREHGAYFFAPVGDVSAEDIREQMGTFDSIKVVAKYASRLGQSFSTTRIPWEHVDIQSIPDVNRNGYCFTDGVGKMSTFVAQMIADGLKLPSSPSQCPTAYQFRLGGHKGIIVIDPSVKGRTLQLRPSQDKFPAKQKSLEICRAAQYSAAFLNQQIILLLDVLGVPPEVLIQRQQDMISELQTAMRDEKMALKLLVKSIDQNQTTIFLANMIQDGFMKTHEPFFVSCMQLWRSWTVKLLKEKAKILVPDGAFLLGCVDETALLRGHDENNRSALPEIFIQTSCYDSNDPARTGNRIITGLCMVARNPSLHPGDVRVVMAVDRPELRHLRNVVVFPQTGDRDIPGMCSGGDLDGDDYLVIWDQDLIPKEWNHEPMDYTPPKPETEDEPITVEDITSFFIKHLRNDNLGRIAVAHRYWADLSQKGAKDDNCLELAALHSRAVDYAKTGVPAIMGRHLRVNKWPRWANTKNIREAAIYDSDKVLHQLYKSIDLIGFEPVLFNEFDRRILEAYSLNNELLASARQIKDQYDAALRRLMSQHEIKSEYEVWTTFVLAHNEDIREWTLIETLGNLMSAIKHHHRQLVFEQAGTSEREQDHAKLGPYVAAMYTVTAIEASVLDLGGTEKPLLSFPWLFQRELGLIANGQFARPAMPSTRITDSLPEPLISLSDPPAVKITPIESMTDLIQFDSSPGVADPRPAISTKVMPVATVLEVEPVESDSDEEVVLVPVSNSLDRLAALLGI